MQLLREAHTDAAPLPPAEGSGAGCVAGPLRSAIYTGWVRHRRFMPRALQFRYRLFLMYVDLSELDQVFARRWLWSVGRANLAQFRRSDYLAMRICHWTRRYATACRHTPASAPKARFGC